MSADVNPDAYSPSTSEFLAALEESGLFHASEVVELRDRFGRDADPRDAGALARRLITEGVLTDFQAERLLLGYKQGLVYGRYAVLDMIGAGAMGRVFKARHLLMDRVVALKLIRPDGPMIVRSIRPPEMMHPSQTRESVAIPMRAPVSSANTNLAGGSGTAQVRIGQRGL